MPQFKGKLLYFNIDKAKWSKEFRRDMERLTRNAAREWLRSLITKVPQWSGMAAGSIKFARGYHGSLAKYLNVNFPINAINNGQPGRFSSPLTGKKVHLDKRKTPEAGGKLAKYSFKYIGNTYSFEFQSKVPHYIHNDFFERTDAGASGQQIMAPWLSVQQARVAFYDYIRQEIKARRFARIKDFIFKSEVNSLNSVGSTVSSSGRIKITNE